jgi:hypothetical protein
MLVVGLFLEFLFAVAGLDLVAFGVFAFSL